MGRRRRVIDEVRGHPRWGATKAQGKRNAEIRALKNRIHDLETQIAGGDTRNTGAILCHAEFDALVTVCRMPFMSAVDLGLVHALHQLAPLTRRLRVYASGKVTS